ncbi:LTR Retrotransposon [Trachipleistophora hominis]|uniref:LTR Retrotransposon n=1 Tax=Trachipleistophora hominis TaxID=72359 RepID=L7JT92_TRAHO|nr:LTR Retrotransposon [Trachipleistophora hominis]
MFDFGIVGEVPGKENTEKLIIEAHLKANYRGLEPTYYELKERYHWLGMKRHITEIIKRCETCQQNNRKHTEGNEMVSTTRPLEKVAIDIVKIKEETVMIAIDYFSRIIWVRDVGNRRKETIIEKMNELVEEWGVPEMIITDNTKEFVAIETKNWMTEARIIHEKTSVESHKSNGRVERVIRTVREAIEKMELNEMGKAIKEVEDRYNKTYHAGIKCTPEEAWKDITGIAAVENSKDGRYNKQFKKRKREKFAEGQQVIVAQKENLRDNDKIGRFVEKDEVIAVCKGDSYLIRRSGRGILKKRHYDLRARW